MTTRGPNLTRRADLEAALKRAKAKDVISLQGLADLYGTSKQNFTNILRQIERMFDMPAWVPGPRGIHVYPARAAIRTILAYEKRNDQQAESLQARTAAILGKGKKKPPAGEAMIPMSELAIASRVMAETEERERLAGEYCSLDDLARTAGDVFAMISGFLSELDAHVDPNGVLPADMRAIIRDGGKQTSMEIHAQMRDMLSGRAIPQPRRPKKTREPHGGSRRAPSRRARR